MKGRTFIPTDSPEDWKRFLADPEKQWRDGYSAKSTALHWEKSKGLPQDIKHVIEKAGLKSPELLLAIPEWKTPLPGGRRDSQTDVFALIRTEEGLISCAVEAKVAEPFGPTVGEWLNKASDGKLERLEYLKNLLGISGDVDHLRYQLLHRTASAIIEAKNFDAYLGAMIVQSFHKDSLWKEDLIAFASAMNVELGSISKTLLGQRILLGWSNPQLP